MTRERAAEICQSIKFMVDNEYYSEEVEEALNMAIQALEKQSPCDMCEHQKEDCWEMCQFCPAEPKGE